MDKTIENIIVYSSDEIELDKNPTVKKYLIVQQEGNREVEYYNLDMIISIGYRVNSLEATKFRQWATTILKQYITNGYTINSDKITHQRFKELENDIVLLKDTVDNISSKELYNIGASFKDVSKKIFSVNRMDRGLLQFEVLKPNEV